MISRLLRALQSRWRRTGPPPSGVTGATSDTSDVSDTSDTVVHDVPQTHEEVADYWTDERLRAAKPREQKLPPPGGHD